MIEEPYRWVEAIANRREYIDHQLATGSPIVSLSFDAGILFFTLSRERQKIFEIYDRIGMGGIGHPGDIERLRMAAIELCSTEGFVRSPLDVSLRRLANYSLSPSLKAAFEQVYGPPYLARMLFAELGHGDHADVFLRVEYDGSMHSNGGLFAAQAPQAAVDHFGVISGTRHSAAVMEQYLRGKESSADGGPRQRTLAQALDLAANAWALGHLALKADAGEDMPSETLFLAHRQEQLAHAAVEAATLDRHAAGPVAWQSLADAFARPILMPP